MEKLEYDPPLHPQRPNHLHPLPNYIEGIEWENLEIYEICCCGFAFKNPYSRVRYVGLMENNRRKVLPGGYVPLQTREVRAWNPEAAIINICGGTFWRATD